MDEKKLKRIIDDIVTSDSIKKSFDVAYENAKVKNEGIVGKIAGNAKKYYVNEGDG